MRGKGIHADCDVQLGVFITVSPNGFFGLRFADDVCDYGIVEGCIGWGGVPIYRMVYAV